MKSSTAADDLKQLQIAGRPLHGNANLTMPKRKVRLDRRRYRSRWMVEAVFCRLKDFRRVATRYDKLARNYVSTITIATIIAY